jgi:acyl carrier protein
MVEVHRSDPILRSVIAAIGSAAKGPMPQQIEPQQSFINDLGFDSMSLALLALALEDEFDQPILLHDWIARHADFTTLTVASLCAFLAETMLDERPSVQL